MTPEQEAKCREAFEEWAVANGYEPMSRRYLAGWHIWQAAWQAAQAQGVRGEGQNFRIIYYPPSGSGDREVITYKGEEIADVHYGKTKEAILLLRLAKGAETISTTPPEQPALEKLVEGRE